MQVIKHLATGLILLVTSSCIDPYHPRLTETQDLLVVNGMITDQPGEYVVEISRSAPFDNPTFIPVEGCLVQVADDNGSAIIYSEYSPGVYKANLDDSFLGINKAYQLYVRTPDGREYLSEYDPMLACPPIDKLYTEVEIRGTEDPEVNHNGLQFYVDVKGSRNESGNFLWKLEETYEYNSSYQIQYIWDGVKLKEFFPADSLYTCYKTQPVQELHTASTRYLAKNELIKYPLSYVSDESPRLRVRYSLLVRQYSLSENAFLYWDKLKNQLTGRGGLYQTQPYSSDGNVFNIDDPDEKVLGYFYASQVKETRIMVEKPFKVRRILCTLDTIDSPMELPVGFIYLISLNEMTFDGPPYGYTYNDCFDCQLNGGTITPPDYWPDR